MILVGEMEGEEVVKFQQTLVGLHSFKIRMQISSNLRKVYILKLLSR
jgi:hypothetical protein